MFINTGSIWRTIALYGCARSLNLTSESDCCWMSIIRQWLLVTLLLTARLWIKSSVAQRGKHLFTSTRAYPCKWNYSDGRKVTHRWGLPQGTLPDSVSPLVSLHLYSSSSIAIHIRGSGDYSNHFLVRLKTFNVCSKCLCSQYLEIEIADW